MGFFLSKKQKQQMKERRRKKEMYEKGLLVPSSEAQQQYQKQQQQLQKNKEDDVEKKATTASDIGNPKKRSRPIPSEDEQTNEKKQSFEVKIPKYSDCVAIPSHLDKQQAKKYRKEARRLARQQGRDDTKLTFVVGDGNNNDGESKKKKRKKEFPNIKELVEREKLEKEKKVMEEARKVAEAEIPDAIKSQYVAIDCEMVGIGPKARKSVLARVAVTDWHGEVLLDTFVRVIDKVTDYRTSVSGVEKGDVKSDTAMPPTEVRKKVADLLKGKILVGHSLKNDFDVLFLKHPKQDIRDTAKYRPFQKQHGDKWKPRKLRELAKEYLELDIQKEGESHSPVDDANAAMELYKCVRKEWEQMMLDKLNNTSHSARRRAEQSAAESNPDVE